MKYLQVKNWDQFQQYKDRDPKWIKLHRDVLDDYEFDGLTEIQQCHLVKIWLLAAKLGNKIPSDPKWIARKIGAQSTVDTDQLVTSGFLVPYKSVQECTETYLEEEREEEGEEEGERARRAASTLPKPDFLNDQVWNDYRSFRTSKRAKLTPTAWKKIQNELERGIARGHDPNDMLGEAMVAGWTGFKSEWYENRINGTGKQSGGSSDGWSDVLQIITKSRGDQQAWLEKNPEYRTAIQSIGGLKQLGMMNDFQLKDAQQRFADALAERRAS